MLRIVPLRCLGAVTALLFLAMAIHAAPLQPSIPAIQFCYSEVAFRSVLEQWGADGVARFKWHFAFDFAFLASYGFFGYELGRHPAVTRHASSLGKALLRWCLPVAAVLDATENLLHLTFVSITIALPAMLYVFAGLVATLKWVLIAAFAIELGCNRVRAFLEPDGF